MSKRRKVAKGQRNEKKCADELIKLGFTYIWKSVRHRFLNIDLFGLFDVVGLNPVTKILKFVQVKSNKCDGKVRDTIREFPLPTRCPDCGRQICEKEIWIWDDYKGWRKEYYD